MARKTKTTLTFAVTIEMPHGANIPAMRDHIKRSIEEYRKGYSTDTPMFALRTDNVRVHLMNKEVSYG